MGRRHMPTTSEPGGYKDKGDESSSLDMMQKRKSHNHMERVRRESLSNAFKDVKRLNPWLKKKKSSRLDIIRHTAELILYLQEAKARWQQGDYSRIGGPKFLQSNDNGKNQPDDDSDDESEEELNDESEEESNDEYEESNDETEDDTLSENGKVEIKTEPPSLNEAIKEETADASSIQYDSKTFQEKFDSIVDSYSMVFHGIDIDEM